MPAIQGFYFCNETNDDLLKTFYFLLLFAFLGYCCNTSSRDKKPEEDSLQYYPATPEKIDQQEFREYYRKLSAFFDTTLLRNSNFNGGILIAKNGSVIYERYTGKVDLRRKDTLTENTPLHIASTTKTFTGIAVLRLIQEGRLSPNDTITKFFPSLPYPGITVKMLLNHRSGLPNYVHFMDKTSWDKKQYATNSDVLSILIKDKPNINFQPGKRFSYCNTNYILLAMIIEKITGKPYPEYMQQKFFLPLQMKNTYVFTLKDTLTATPSFNYNGNYWNYDFLDGTYGDKNIYSTPQDLLKWDQALYSDQVLSKPLLDSAFAPYSFEKPSIHNYGLGWRLQLLPNGKKVVYHFGKWHGFNAAFARLTEEKVTIIILGNRFTRSIYGTAHLCYDIFGDYLQRGVKDEEESDSLSSKKGEPATAERKKIPSKKINKKTRS
ncbi:MAG: beta-lactamase family protein [Chitinophagaceae bacterium]|nr:beta-lactamase family protein [Chitinophagaceae bacterium]